MSHFDWLSQLVKMINVTGRPEIRCVYGAPWRVTWDQAAANEIPYHVVLKGRAIIEDPETGTTKELVAGDIVLLPHGSAHVLHDGSGNKPIATREQRDFSGLTRSENEGEGLDMLCGRFFIASPHDRLIRDYLPTNLVVRTTRDSGDSDIDPASNSLANFVALIREESTAERVGGYAILNALSSALFTIVLREASKSAQAPTGLLALAGHPRLAPAISAIFSEPARAWNLLELAALCNMSRATFVRHFQDTLGRSAVDLLIDIRMSHAANELKKPTMTTEAVAESVGYQSVTSFRRLFADRMGVTPGEWRRLARQDR